MTTTKGRHFHPQALSTTEVEALMAACSATSPTGKRNRALIVAGWRGALRCEEALHLKVHDLDRATGNIRVMFGKGSKARTVGIEPRAWAVLEVWLAERERLGVPRAVPLFCTVSGGNYHKLSSRYVRWMMTDLGGKAELGKRVHFHGLRHSRASEAADDHVPVHHLKAFLGHSNVGTTDRYISQLNPRAAIDAMLASQWGRDSDG